jgi:hypothetical protein
MNFPGYDLNKPRDCREASALNDRFIHRYMGLLDRFSMLPACEDLIYNQVKGEFPKDYLDSLATFSCLPPPGDPLLDNENTESLPAEDEEENDDDNPDAVNEEGDAASDEDEEPKDDNEDDAALPEEMKLMRQLERRGRMMISSVYQIMFDWCNLYSIVIPAEQRREGLQVLVLLGLCLGNLNSSMDQLACFQTEMAITLCEKAHVNNKQLCALMTELMKKCENLKTIIEGRVRSIQALDTALLEHIATCRKLGDQARPY